MNEGHGLIFEEIQPNNYVLGGFQLAQETMVESGQWDNYLPEPEIQRNYGLETKNCTSYGTLNCIEVLLKKKYGLDVNYSERYTGILADNTREGNSPHRVAEIIRKRGVILDEYLPFDPLHSRWDTYYNPKPMKDYLLRRGRGWLDEYEFGHEWLFYGGEQKQEKIKQALLYSPIGVSVYAWSNPNADGFYFKGGRDNHWVTLYGYKDKAYWLIFDSYDNIRKKIDWNYDFEMAKRFHIEKRIIKQSWPAKLLSILKRYTWEIIK